MVSKDEKVYSHTKAICPTCNSLVIARIVESDGKVYLRKLCPRDGITEALICSDARWYTDSMSYIKPGQLPLDVSVKEFSGCPESCGLCPEHQQHTCLPVIEITNDCNLNCPVCLKNPDRPYQMSIREFEGILNRLMDCEGSVHVINLSGGEPTEHPELMEFLEISRKSGVIQATVSTNGLSFIENQRLLREFKESGAIAALQFDGFRPETYKALRGSDLSTMKREIIEVLEADGIKYSLVATVMRGVNDTEITDIVDFFFRSKALSLMFQPVTFTGRARRMGNGRERLTTPDVVKEIEKSAFVKQGDFNPLPCAHFSCFSLSYYLSASEGNFMSLKDFLGLGQYLNVIANRTLPGLDQEGYQAMMDSLYDLWSASDSSNDNEAVLKRIRLAIEKLGSAGFSAAEAFKTGSEFMKAIFIHEFMDRDTLDLGRLMKCCNHYPQTDGRLVPMCAQNVFFQEGSIA